MYRKLVQVSVVLWAGSLWSLAAWVAPTLFYAQPDRHLAGVLAGRLFRIEAYVAAVVAVLALLAAEVRKKFAWGYVGAALLVLNDWVLRSWMVRAHAEGSALGLSFGAWHGVSAVLYVFACVAVLVLVWNEDFR